MVPKPIVLVDPVTGSEAPGYASGSGISPVPASYFDGYLDAPRFRRGQANLTTIESLIEHVNRFKDSQSVLFAVDDRKRPSITAIIDYHRSEEHTSELQSLMRISYAVFCLKKKTNLHPPKDVLTGVRLHHCHRTLTQPTRSS